MPRPARCGQCVYCCTYGPVTSDHVPPKCLFAPHTRVNLITVYACPKCHEGFKLDDEYFRVFLAARADLPENAEGNYIREQTNRALGHTDAKRFRSMLRASIKSVQLYSTEGIYIRHAPTITINAGRIRSTTERIVRGLYAHYLGHPVPETHVVAVSPLDFQRNNSALESQEIQEGLVLLGAHGVRKVFGLTLELRYMKADDDPLSTFWWIRLHSVFGVLAYTVPRDAS